VGEGGGLVGAAQVVEDEGAEQGRVHGGGRVGRGGARLGEAVRRAGQVAAQPGQAAVEHQEGGAGRGGAAAPEQLGEALGGGLQVARGEQLVDVQRQGVVALDGARRILGGEALGGGEGALGGGGVQPQGGEVLGLTG